MELGEASRDSTGFAAMEEGLISRSGPQRSLATRGEDWASQGQPKGKAVCELLRGIVATTKAAALQYPSPAAAQDMVDRVKELGHSTQQFRRVLGQLAAA